MATLKINDGLAGSADVAASQALTIGPSKSYYILALPTASAELHATCPVLTSYGKALVTSWEQSHCSYRSPPISIDDNGRVVTFVSRAVEIILIDNQRSETSVLLPEIKEKAVRTCSEEVHNVIVSIAGVPYYACQLVRDFRSVEAAAQRRG